MTTPLDPRTLRWAERRLLGLRDGAERRRADHEANGNVIAMTEEEGEANAFGYGAKVMREKLAEDRAIEKRRTKKAGKRS